MDQERVINVFSQRVFRLQEKNRGLREQLLRLQGGLARTEPRARAELFLQSTAGFRYSSQSPKQRTTDFRIQCPEKSKFCWKKPNAALFLAKKSSPGFESAEMEAESQLATERKVRNPREAEWRPAQINRLIFRSVFAAKEKRAPEPQAEERVKDPVDQSLKKVKTELGEVFRERRFSLERVNAFLSGFSSPNGHTLAPAAFKAEFEEIFRSVSSFHARECGQGAELRTQESLFSCRALPLRKTRLDPFAPSNSLSTLRSANALSRRTLLALLLLIAVNFQSQIEAPEEKVQHLLGLLLQCKDRLVAAPFLRVVNAIFKKLPSEIDSADVRALLARVSNAFGYVEKLFKELLLFAETQIVNRGQRSLNLAGFRPLRITQNATFQGACGYYLKRDAQLAGESRFFAGVGDILTSLRAVTALPCMVHLNHRLMGLLRNYIGSPKFAGSEQQVIFMYLAREIPLSS